MRSRHIDSIRSIGTAEWNALATDYPFLRHEFLAALEDTGCAGAASGWMPAHLLIEDAAGLAAVAPLYEKSHSWGEFVFDFAWARAWESRGLAYYPKLVMAIPFTPASGPRVLVRHGADAAALRRTALTTILARSRARGCSSIHALFIDEPLRADAEAAGWLLRRDCQFLWRNRSYRDFEDFLAGFAAEKRKKARRERRRVSEQGIGFRTLDGHSIDPARLDLAWRFHADTFARHGHTPYLNRACFQELAATLGSAMVFKFAERAGQAVAAAIFFRSTDTLYGRYWGAAQEFHSLHFETCYHQGIEYCIEHGLARFEPGTQGEHKIARGFEPVHTWSAHWLEDTALRRAVAQHLRLEGAAVDEYAAAAAAHTPFRRGAAPARPDHERDGGTR
ncbi:MAG: GNAT family N-acetyltransferase [Gammaproteobacteria bacterium]|nr:GNAT family N-acetyltransferase [Gammaproteobacteria bacterium]